MYWFAPRKMLLLNHDIFGRAKGTNRFALSSHINKLSFQKIFGSYGNDDICHATTRVQMFWSKKKRNYVDIVNCRKSVWTMVKSEKWKADTRSTCIWFVRQLFFQYLQRIVKAVLVPNHLKFPGRDSSCSLSWTKIYFQKKPLFLANF